MKIRTQFILSTIIFAVILAAVGATVIYNMLQLRGISRQESTARNLVREANELSYLASDYLIYRGDLQLSRWESKYNSFSTELLNLNPGTVDQMKAADHIKSDFELLGAVFRDVRAYLEASQTQGETTGFSMIEISWSRLMVQNQEIISDTLQLDQMLRNQIDGLNWLHSALIFILIGIFVAFLLATYFLNYLPVIKSVALLQAGTKVVGSGNLEYTLPDEGRDEIADLSRAFNRMTTDLKAVTASRQELYKEMKERIQAEQALRDSEARYRALVDLSPDAIVVHRDGQFLYANPAALKMYGAGSFEELARFSLYDLLHPDERTDVMNRVQQATDGVTTPLHERQARRINGEPWVMEVSGGPVQWQGVAAVQVFIRDITARKQAEEAVQKNAKELETAVKDLESFGYSVTHDLKQPLRTMGSFSELLYMDYKDKLDETGKDYLERIRKASLWMSELTDDMLKLSRITSLEIKREPVDLSNLALAIAEELKADQPARQAEIKIAPGLVISGDRQLLNIALQNLLENAWKFTSKGQLTRIELGVTEKGMEKVYFVRDNGVGFDMKYIDRLFIPFRRLTTDKGYPGTGIGLAIAQRVIRRHGGKIWAEAEIGKGATFYFTTG